MLEEEEKREKKKEQVQVYYFESRFISGGPTQEPYQPIAPPLPIETKEPSQLDLTLEIEEKILELKFKKPNGNFNILKENDEKFFSILLPYLKDKESIKEIIGEGSYCSFNCQGLQNIQPTYQLVDKGRIKLKCGHFFMHTQCYLTEKLNLPHCFSACPI